MFILALYKGLRTEYGTYITNRLGHWASLGCSALRLDKPDANLVTRATNSMVIEEPTLEAASRGLQMYTARLGIC